MNVSFKKYLSDMTFYLTSRKSVKKFFFKMFPKSCRTNKAINKRIADFVQWEAKVLFLEDRIEATTFDDLLDYETNYLYLSRDGLMDYIKSIYNDDYSDDIAEIALSYADLLINECFPEAETEDLLGTRCKNPLTNS